MKAARPHAKAATPLALRSAVPMLLIDGTKLIVVALLPARDEVAAVVRSKVALVIPAKATVKEFIAMIRAVATQRGKPRSVTFVRLTGREKEVIELIADGSSNQEIAGALTIAAHTVKTHVHNILEKLALRTRLQIAAYAHAEGYRAFSNNHNNHNNHK